MSTDDVYFFACNGEIKIGTSRKSKERLKEWQRQLRRPIEIFGTIPGGRIREASIHKLCAEYNLDGEWFRDCAEVRAIIAELLAHPPPRVARDTPKTPLPQYGPFLSVEHRHAIDDRRRDQFFSVVDGVSVVEPTQEPDVAALPTCLRRMIANANAVIMLHRTMLTMDYFDKEQAVLLKSRNDLLNRISVARTLVANLLECNREQSRRDEAIAA